MISVNLMPAPDENSSIQADNNPKRKRIDGFSPTNIDVTQLDENRFALLSGLEVENVEGSPRTKNQLNSPPQSPKIRTGHYCQPIFLFNANIKRLVSRAAGS